MCPDRQDKGFTLIEVMISIVILFIGMMGVLDFLCIYHRFNIENTIKNEAVKIAEMRMEQLRSEDFTTLINGSVPAPGITRRIRNLTVTYGVVWTVQNITPNSRAVQVDVTWKYPDIATAKVRSHNAQTIISNEV